MKISASLVLFNQHISEIKEVLNSLSNIDILVYVIDNSDDSILEKHVRNYKNFIYIKSETNLGFGKAHNLGINEAIKLKSKFHLIVNPDIKFSKNDFEELIIKINSEEKIGIISPKIKYLNNETQYLCKLTPTPYTLIIRRFIPIKKLINKINYKYEMKFMNYNESFNPPTVSGCFMILRTKLLEKIKGFDERYFMYLEDVDLCRKVLKENYEILHYPKSEVIHIYEKGSYKNYKLLKYHIISSFKYFNKWGWIFDKDRVNINKKSIKNNL